VQHRPLFCVATCARTTEMKESHGDSYALGRACHLMMMMMMMNKMHNALPQFSNIRKIVQPI